MKQRYTLLCLALVVLLFTACPLGPKMVLNNFIGSYSISYEVKADDVSIFEDDIIGVHVLGKEFISVYSEGLKKKKYDELAAKYHDTGWNQQAYTMDVMHQTQLGNFYPASRVTDIHMRLENDAWEGLEKGASLDDKFIFLSSYLDDYIRNNYHFDKAKCEAILSAVPQKHQSIVKRFSDPTLPIYEVLEKVRFENYQLLDFVNSSFCLIPIQTAPIGAEISIHVCFEDGTELVYPYTFVEGSKE